MPPLREVRVRRVYDPVAPGDMGHRVLVDRLWPRGVNKADAALDEWLKDVAPSTELRRWYGHDPSLFDEFARRYRAALRRPPASAAVRHLVGLARQGPIVLLTATRDVEHSGARVLQEHLTRRPSSAAGSAPQRQGPGRRSVDDVDDVVRNGDTEA